MILVRRDLPVADVATLVKLLHSAAPTLAEKLEQGKFSTATNTAAYQPAERLHPAMPALLEQLR